MNLAPPDSASVDHDAESENRVLRALAALSQPHRLRAFRALVVAGPQGLTPGALSSTLELAPSALSFHLKELTHAGLVTSEARGRFLIYRAEFAQINTLLGYLTRHCCQGAACEAGPVSACRTC